MTTLKEKLKNLTHEQLEVYTQIAHNAIHLLDIRDIDFCKLVDNLDLVEACSNLHYEVERINDDYLDHVYSNLLHVLKNRITL